MNGLTETAHVRGATEGPCWVARCRGRAFWPPPGDRGPYLVRCDNWDPHVGVMSPIGPPAGTYTEEIDE